MYLCYLAARGGLCFGAEDQCISSLILCSSHFTPSLLPFFKSPPLFAWSFSSTSIFPSTISSFPFHTSVSNYFYHFQILRFQLFIPIFPLMFLSNPCCFLQVSYFFLKFNHFLIKEVKFPNLDHLFDFVELKIQNCWSSFWMWHFLAFSLFLLDTVVKICIFKVAHWIPFQIALGFAGTCTFRSWISLTHFPDSRHVD